MRCVGGEVGGFRVQGSRKKGIQGLGFKHTHTHTPKLPLPPTHTQCSPQEITRIMKVSPDAVKLRATDVLLSVTQHDVASIREFLLHQVCVCEGEGEGSVWVRGGGMCIPRCPW